MSESDLKALFATACAGSANNGIFQPGVEGLHVLLVADFGDLASEAQIRKVFVDQKWEENISFSWSAFHTLASNLNLENRATISPEVQLALDRQPLPEPFLSREFGAAAPFLPLWAFAGPDFGEFGAAAPFLPLWAPAGHDFGEFGASVLLSKGKIPPSPSSLCVGVEGL